MILLPDQRFLIWRQGEEVSFPTQTEVNVPPPETPSERLGVYSHTSPSWDNHHILVLLISSTCDLIVINKTITRLFTPITIAKINNSLQ
jgi:hypothetical protein